MATYKEIEDDLVICPYDKNHRIARRRYQIHVSECGSKAATSKLVACEYNGSHRVLASSMRFHLMRCPDAKAQMGLSVQEMNSEMKNINTSTGSQDQGPSTQELLSKKEYGDDGCDPWAAEGLRSGVKHFKMKGLGRTTVDVDQLYNPERPIDMVQLQKLDPAEKRLVYKARQEKEEMKKQEVEKPMKKEQDQEILSVSSMETHLPGTICPLGVSSRHHSYSPITARTIPSLVEEENVDKAMPSGLGRGIPLNGLAHNFNPISDLSSS
jgi:hypothetical protein